MKILLGYLFTYTYITSILILITLLKKNFKLKEQTSRKLIHISVGFSWFIMVYFFETTYHLIIPPLTFIIINYFLFKKNFLISQNEKSKKSYGTIFYALSFTILAIITYISPKFLPFYGLSVITMALADGIAPFVGRHFPNLKILNTSKTYAGSLIIFLTTIIVSIFFTYYYNLNLNTIKILLLSISSTLLELVDYKGLDNITLPIGTFLISIYLALGV